MELCRNRYSTLCPPSTTRSIPEETSTGIRRMLQTGRERGTFLRCTSRGVQHSDSQTQRDQLSWMRSTLQVQQCICCQSSTQLEHGECILLKQSHHESAGCTGASSSTTLQRGARTQNPKAWQFVMNLAPTGEPPTRRPGNLKLGRPTHRRNLLTFLVQKARNVTPRIGAHAVSPKRMWCRVFLSIVHSFHDLQAGDWGRGGEPVSPHIQPSKRDGRMREPETSNVEAWCEYEGGG